MKRAAYIKVTTWRHCSGAVRSLPWLNKRLEMPEEVGWNAFVQECRTNQITYSPEHIVKWFNPQRWTELWKAAALERPSCSFQEMVVKYSEPWRHYHNSQHIDDCLQEFDATAREAANPIALELAIWFHDAVYDPLASDNEEQSARFAMECLKYADAALAGVVSDLALTTKSHRPGNTPDAALLIDIDLSILGKSAECFAEYESGIRREYHWVPIQLYREKRAEILRSFLDRDRIYLTDSFFQRFETGARRNLSKSIEELESSLSRR